MATPGTAARPTAVACSAPRVDSCRAHCCSGLAHRNVALRVTYLDGILVFLGGIIGTGYHWYFEGHNTFNMAISGIFSVREVVPLTLVTLDAWSFVKTTRNKMEIDGIERRVLHKWTFCFLMAMGFWNFVDADMFEFLINLPIVSYYETGTLLPPTTRTRH